MPLPISPWLNTALLCAGAMLLDRLLGEPRHYHPLVGFGRFAAWQERLWRRVGEGRMAGLLAWSFSVLPWVALALLINRTWPAWRWLPDLALLYFALGARSLTQHGEQVAQALAEGDLATARTRVGWIVSRDTTDMDDSAVARAATESILENGNDAVFGALFWFCLGGGPLALLFRLANTLDAMWGYRTTRYLHFGWAAARLDDLLNYLPARLTALTYGMLGHTRTALQCWRRQAGNWDSPNAGPVMAAGAGALQVRLGGPARYHGQIENRPELGRGDAAALRHVRGALRLVQHGQLLWLLLLLGGGAIGMIAHA